MNTIKFRLQSIQTRITVLMLLVFVLAIWALTAYVNRMLQEDLQVLLGEQQMSTTTLLTAEINQEVAERISALQLAASQMTPALLQRPAALQAWLERQSLLRKHFNDGLACTDASGTVLADFPHVAGRIGANFSERDYIQEPLRLGRALVSKPVRSKITQVPMFVIAVPIKNANGEAVGVLGGVTDLGKANFLNKVTQGYHLDQGDYFVNAGQARLVVTSSNKSRILATLPAPGVNPMLDQHIQGWEGTHVFTNPLGVTTLTSIKQIPAAGWYVGVTLALEKAYAPITTLQQRLLAAAAALTLLVGLLSWWLLQRQLAPLLSTAKTLSKLTPESGFPDHLPVHRFDEVGHLIVGFNQLLTALHQRETELRRSEQRFRTLIEWSPEAFGVHRDGKFIYVNPAAVKLYGASCERDLIGKPVMELVHPDFRPAVQERIRQSLADGGKIPMLEEKLVKFDGSVMDAEVTAIPIDYDGQTAVQVAVHDITERKRTEREIQALLRDKLALLNEVHHRVKNNLQVIISLLRLEANRSSQGETHAVLYDMVGRIRSMALLHEMLYRSGNFAAIDLGNYLRQLATQSFRAMLARGSALRLVLELEPVQVSLEQALPCGMLVNELLANCLKHGFPDGGSGSVRIALQAEPAAAPATADTVGESESVDRQRVRLCVSDTGIGLPADFEERSKQSLGLQLAGDLVRQLNATLAVGPGPGAQFIVTFAIA